MIEEPSFAEVIAELAMHSRRLEEEKARLAAEQVTVQALDGQLFAAAAADGRLLALRIEPDAVRGPQGRRLGDHLVQIITAVRTKAAARRAELEGG